MELIPLLSINERAVTDPAEFIAECEAEYDRRIKGAGDLIASDICNRPILLLSGPSSSGKTTTAKRISEYLKQIGINSHAISIDDYFTDVTEDSPKNEKGEFDFETPECVDSTLLKEHIDRLYHGEEVVVPRFDFKKQKRAPEGVPVRLMKDEVAIFEGIHALNESVTGASSNIAHMLYTRVSSQVVNSKGAIFLAKGTVRLIRRTVRDLQFRGTDASETFSMWENVRAGEHKHIVPYSDNADIEIDSFLPYEIGALKAMAIEAIRSVDQNNPGYPLAEELLYKLPFFAAIDHALIPKSSILREFIGGADTE